VRYDPQAGQFVDPKFVTDGSVNADYPKVLTSGDRLVVTFVTTNGVLNDRLASRDAVYSGGTPIWDTFTRFIPTTTLNFESQSTAVRGNTLHALLFSGVNGGIYVSSRTLPSGDWGTPELLDDAGSEVTNFRRSLVSYGDTVYAAYGGPQVISPDVFSQIEFRNVSDGGWSDPPYVIQSVNTVDPPPNLLQRSTLSASSTGRYVFWVQDINASRWMRRNVRTLSGSITENMFWTGNNWVNGALFIESGTTVRAKAGSVTTVLAHKTITIKPGATLIAEAGAQFKFESGASIFAQGTFHAVGTAQSPIVFQGNNGATWGGIVLYESGANNSQLTYATISNVLTYGGSALNITGATGVSVRYCTIINNTGGYANNGLSVSNAGWPDIGYNTIVGTTGYGVSFQNSYGYLYGNVIKYNGFGGVSCSFASPTFGKPGIYSYNGNNTIKGGPYGIRATASSYPYVGSCYNTMVGYNDIDSSSTKRVYAINTSDVLAEKNWWGTPNPTSALFQTDGSSSIDWGCYLTNDPTPASIVMCELGEISSPNSLVKGDDSYVSDRDEESGTESVTDDLFMGRYEAAQRKLLSALDTKSPSIRKTAAQVLALYRTVRTNEIFDSYQRYVQANDVREPVQQLVYGNLLLAHGDAADGAMLLRRIGSEYPLTDYERQSLLCLYYFYLSDSTLSAESSNLVRELAEKFPEDPDVLQAVWTWGLSNDADGMHRVEASSERKTDQPVSFMLEQNYPNPFNPTTRIEYRLPSDGFVSLKVYDVLGREVASLVDEVKPAGVYTATWHATTVATGVYFTRLEMGGKVLAKKLMVLK